MAQRGFLMLQLACITRPCDSFPLGVTSAAGQGGVMGKTVRFPGPGRGPLVVCPCTVLRLVPGHG